VTLSQTVVYTKAIVPLKSSEHGVVLLLGRKTIPKMNELTGDLQLSKQKLLCIVWAASLVRSEGTLRSSSTSPIPFASNRICPGCPCVFSAVVLCSRSLACVWRNFAFLLTAQTSWEKKGTSVSKVEWEYCLPKKC